MSVDTRCAVAEVRVRHLEAAHAALVAALDALIALLRQRADNAESCNFSMSAHGIRMCVEELEAVVAAHRT